MVDFHKPAYKPRKALLTYLCMQSIHGHQLSFFLKAKK